MFTQNPAKNLSPLEQDESPDVSVRVPVLPKSSGFSDRKKNSQHGECWLSFVELHDGLNTVLCYFEGRAFRESARATAAMHARSSSTPQRAAVLPLLVLFNHQSSGRYLSGKDGEGSFQFVFHISVGCAGGDMNVLTTGHLSDCRQKSGIGTIAK